MQWEQVVDVSEHVDFATHGLKYTNSFVIEGIDQYSSWEDAEDDINPVGIRWYVIVYDGWEGKHSGSSSAHHLPKNWDVL